MPNLTVSPDVLERQLGDRLVLLQLETGEYHALNETGMIVWNGIRNGWEVSEIVGYLMERFDAPAAVLSHDVEACVASLLGRSLVQSGK